MKLDSSLMGAINAMSSYQETFGLSGAGSTTGVIFIIYNLGQIAAFPFCGFFADGYGRRVCIFVGCLIVIVGTAIQTTADTTGQFMGGRFLLGMGAAIASAAGPTYTVELAHPAYRGVMAGMYNVFWWIGSCLAGWTTVSFLRRCFRYLQAQLTSQVSFNSPCSFLYPRTTPIIRARLVDWVRFTCQILC